MKRVELKRGMLVRKDRTYGSPEYGVVVFTKPWEYYGGWSRTPHPASSGQGVAVARLAYGVNYTQPDPAEFIRTQAVTPEVWQLRQIQPVGEYIGDTLIPVTNIAAWMRLRDTKKAEAKRRRDEAEAKREAGKEERRKRFHAASALQPELTKGSTVSEDRWGEKASVTMPLEVYEGLVKAIGASEAKAYGEGYKDCQYDYDEKPVVIL